MSGYVYMDFFTQIFFARFFRYCPLLTFAPRLYKIKYDRGHNSAQRRHKIRQRPQLCPASAFLKKPPPAPFGEGKDMSAKRYATVKIIGLCLLLCTLSGCVRHTEPVTQMGFYLDTVVEITLYDTGGTQSGEEILRECFARIEGYEQLFSASVEGSDIWNINHGSGAAVTVSDETAALLRTALYYSELSGGRTDLTVLPLSELWHFGSEQTPAVPADADIREALSHVDYRAVVLEGSTVTLTDPDAAIDLGFIAKGYIADRLRDYLVEQGVDSACINLGQSAGHRDEARWPALQTRHPETFCRRGRNGGYHQPVGCLRGHFRRL